MSKTVAGSTPARPVRLSTAQCGQVRLRASIQVDRMRVGNARGLLGLFPESLWLIVCCGRDLC